jgi:hypothetical protein
MQDMHLTMELPSRPDAALWRPEATDGQLIRAAVGLETIADSCAGRRREELLELARGLRTSAHARRGSPPGEALRRHRG